MDPNLDFQLRHIFYGLDDDERALWLAELDHLLRQLGRELDDDIAASAGAR